VKAGGKVKLDLIINRLANGDVYYIIQHQGVHLLPKKPYHGDDLALSIVRN